MSIEGFITVRAFFPDEDAAKAATSRLKKSLRDNEHELASALHALNPFDNQDDYENDTINVERVSRKKTTLIVDTYSYSSEEPVWFGGSLAALGAKKIHIRGEWDGNVRNYYFLDGARVTKNSAKVEIAPITQKS